MAVPRIEGIEEFELRRFYEVERMPVRSIAECYGVDSSTILSRMKEYGIERRNASESNRVYSINEDFFKTWTPESAWLYGWWLGDGFFATRQKGIGFGLAQLDKEVLEKFKNVLDSNHPIKDSETFNKRYQKFYNRSVVYFWSLSVVSDIKNLSYLDIPEVLLHNFIRGFFEAEGSITWTKLGAIVSSFTQKEKDILEFILWCLKDSRIVIGGSLTQKTSNLMKVYWSLVFGIYDSISLYHYMYNDCGDMFLKRKKEKFEELIRRREE